MLFPELDKENNLDDKLFTFYTVNTDKAQQSTFVCDVRPGKVIHQKLTLVRGRPVLSTATVVNRKEKASFWVV